jgi:hypothetical protein
MSQVLKANSHSTPHFGPTLWLIGGDTLVFLAFVLIGRNNHALAVTNIGAVLFTAAPFLIGWFVVAPWFGLFRAEVSRSWRKWLPRLGLAWAIGGPLALILRTLFLGRPLLEGIIPTFAVVTLTVTTLFLIIWRLGYGWWVNRSTQTIKRG